ncbi:MAG: AMP-binding protein [Bacteroidota bacterium]
MISNLDPFIEKLGRHALEEVQLRKFQIMLDKILTHNTFYQQKLNAAGITSSSDIKSFEDFRKLPFTTKQELVHDQVDNPPYGTNLTFPLELYTRIHQTSGTTGEPLRCLDTEESWDWWARCWAAVYRGAGVTPSDRIFFAFSFGPFIGFWSAYAGAQRIGALALPGGGMSSLQRIKFMLKNEVTVLVCTPTYALHLAEVAEQEGIDLSESNVRITIHAGEPGASLPATKERIERVWGARCCDHAGATEVGAWGFEAANSGSFFVNEAEFIAEVVDKEGNPANEGELIITNLGRLGMPVIRYRTGDRVAIDTSETSSERTFRRLKGGVIGRIDDALIVRGINVFPSAIENIVRRFEDVGEFAVDVYRNKNLDEMEIRVEIGGENPEETAKDIVKVLRNGLGLRVQLNVVPQGTLPRFDLKARRFTDHRKLNLAVAGS